MAPTSGRTDPSASIGTSPPALDLGAAERTQRLARGVVSAAHELRPPSAIEEQLVERRAPHLVQRDGLDQGEPVPQPTAAAARELEVVGHLELARGVEDAGPPALPAGDLLALEARGQQHVEAEDVVEVAVALERLRREGVHHAAVHVQVALHADGLHQQRQGDRDAGQLPERQVGRVGAAEVLHPPAVEVVDDRVERDVGLARRHVPEAAVEEPREGLALGQAGEAAQSRQREARQLGPLDVEVVLRAPREGELGHLLRRESRGPHRAPQRRAGARGDGRRADARLLERARYTHERHAGAAPAGAHHADTLPLERLDRTRLERREHVVDVGRRGAVDDRQRQERLARRQQERHVPGYRADAVQPPELASEVERIEGVECHVRRVDYGRAVSFLTDPTLLYANGRAYARLAPESAQGATAKAAGAGTLAVFLATGVGLLRDHPSTRPFTRSLGYRSGREFMFAFPLRRAPREQPDALAVAAFATYPLWLWLRRGRGRRRRGRS